VKIKTEVIFFTTDIRVENNGDIKSDKGNFYLEKKTGGKFLSFKKGDDYRYIQITKNTFKNLKRLSLGVKMFKFEDIEPIDDIYYCYKQSKKYDPPKIREKNVFVTQVFSCIKSEK